MASDNKNIINWISFSREKQCGHRLEYIRGAGQPQEEPGQVQEVRDGRGLRRCGHPDPGLGGGQQKS